MEEEYRTTPKGRGDKSSEENKWSRTRRLEYLKYLCIYCLDLSVLATDWSQAGL